MECFVILGIEQTDDEQKIRNAYREKLATVNPEYDQEGFMRLRNAYEQALQFAQTSQEEEQETDKGPVDLLIDEFQKVYSRMSDRINPEAWKKLLDHPMFDALDLEETAKWSLFAWLAGHWRLPLSIWRLLDSYFFIGEHKAEFMEKLPGGFVEFILDKLTNKEIVDFPYEEFEPADQESVNYDAFLESYEEIRRLLEEATVEERRESALREAEQKLEYVETLGVIHPWMQLERARFLRKADRSREAEDMVRWLLAHYESDVQVYVGCARILKELGYHQEALPLFERLQKMENLPRGVCYYTTFHLAELYEKEGKLEDARKQCLDAHDFFETDEVLQLMTRINNGLIEQWSKIPEELTEKQIQKLAWCYIQTERYEEGLEFIRTHHMLRGEGFRNYRAMAVLLLQTKHPGEALNYCKEWYVRLEATDFTGLEGEDYFSPEEKTESLAQAREMEGRAYRMLAEEASEEKKEALMKKSVEALELGLELNSGDINLLMTRLMLARELEEYEYITELCQRIMKLDAGFYWAYFYAQEAYEKLQKPQEVIDYFYQAKEIYGGHPEIYERVARVFLEFGQVEDASDILRQAEEAGVSSPTLKVFKVQLLRRQVCDRKTAYEADKYAKKTIGELIREKASDELLAKAYLELAYIQGEEGAKDLGNQKKIAQYSRKSIEYKDTVDARYSLGRALFLFEKDAKGALENLKICEEMGVGYVVTELLSAEAIVRDNKKTLEMLRGIDKLNIPVGIQLFGSNASSLSKAAKIIEELYPNALIDINMGCPVPKVAVKSQAGSFLLKNPAKVYEIVSEVVKAVSIPVTVKIRSGWDENSINAIEIAKLCEKAGASLITVHGRTRSQGYSGKCNLDVIRDIKKNVGIPVIGNGDIIDIESAKKMFDYTKCDAIMIGRGVLGNPWLIRE